MGLGSALIIDRPNLDVALPGGYATVTLAHGHSNGGRMGDEARECLHVHHMGCREYVDPEKLAAITPASPWFNGPPSLQDWKTKEEIFFLAIEGFDRHLDRHLGQSTHPLTHATLQAIAQNPLMRIGHEWGNHQQFAWFLEPFHTLQSAADGRPAMRLMPEFAPRLAQHVKTLMEEKP